MKRPFSEVKMESYNRAIAAYSDRITNGTKFHELGERFGVSIERARQIFCKGERINRVMIRNFSISHLARIQGFSEDIYGVVIGDTNERENP